VLLCIYGFFIDALKLIDRAHSAKLLDDAASRTCRGAVMAWHAATRDLLADNLQLQRYANFLKRQWDRIQAKLFGQRFYRWRG
jgi:hypothetical protein